MKTDLWFLKWHEEFGDQVVESNVDRSLYIKF